MKVPLKWLADYVPLEGVPVAELIRRLTLAGLEVTGVRVLGLPVPEGVVVKPEEAGPVWDPDKVFVAQVLRVEPHPNANRLKLPTVGYGEGRTKRMVTGADNIRVGDKGQKVILGLAGTIYYDLHSKTRELSELKPIELRGQPTDAMLMSEYELGMSEDKSEGILLLEA